jgi:fucose permease
VIAGLGDTIDHWWFLAPLFIGGVGLGLGFSGLFQSVLAGVPPRDAGAGSGSLQAFQQVGGAVGVALVGQIFFSILADQFATGHGAHEAFVAAASTATWYQVASFALVIVLIFFLKPLGPRADATRASAPPVPVEA